MGNFIKSMMANSCPIDLIVYSGFVTVSSQVVSKTDVGTNGLAAFGPGDLQFQSKYS